MKKPVPWLGYSGEGEDREVVEPDLGLVQVMQAMALWGNRCRSRWLGWSRGLFLRASSLYSSSHS